MVYGGPLGNFHQRNRRNFDAFSAPQAEICGIFERRRRNFDAFLSRRQKCESLASNETDEVTYTVILGGGGGALRQLPHLPQRRWDTDRTL